MKKWQNILTFLRSSLKIVVCIFIYLFVEFEAFTEA